MNVLWEERAWADYLYWQKQDRKTLKRINDLVKDMQRNAFDGIGKPEALRGALSGYWSRRIDAANRIVYDTTADGIRIIACRGHYDDA